MGVYFCIFELSYMRPVKIITEQFEIRDDGTS